MADIISLAEGLQALPLPLQLAVGAVVLLLTLLVGRVLSNALPGKAPPVDEGIPFVGGLIKFSKVRGLGRWVQASCPSSRRCCPGRRRQRSCRQRLGCRQPTQPARLPSCTLQHTPSPIHLHASLALPLCIPAGAPASDGGDVCQARRGVHHPAAAQKDDLPHWAPRLPALLQRH